MPFREVVRPADFDPGKCPAGSSEPIRPRENETHFFVQWKIQMMLFVFLQFLFFFGGGGDVFSFPGE